MAVVDTLNYKIPNGTTRYIALLTTMPNALGVGAVEATGSGYSRVAWSAWIDEVIDGATVRKNNGTIEFPVLTGPLSSVLGYGIYTASSGGNLLAWGTFVNNEDEAIYKNFFAGEMPRFIDQELKVGATSVISTELITPSRTVFRVAYSPSLNLFAGIASSGQIQSSVDGRTWTDRFFSASTFNDICWSAELGMFVAVAHTGSLGSRIVMSTNGTSWSHQSSTNTNQWQSVVYADWLNIFVAVANTGTDRVMWSANATAWWPVSADAGTWYRIAASSSVLVAVSSDGLVMYSANGTVWSAGTPAYAGQNWRDVAWSPTLGVFLAIAVNNAYSMTSTDGNTWTARTMPSSDTWESVAWSPLLAAFVAIANSGTQAQRCAVSYNATSWTFVDLGASNLWTEVNGEHPSFVLITSYVADSIVYLAPHTLGSGYAEIDLIDENSLAKMQSYLPPGIAWTRDSDAVLTIFQRALAYTYARIARRAFDLLEEVDPDTTYELLEDWERVYGLPDECNQPTTIAGRRTALQAKMNGNVAPTLANLKARAAELGYPALNIEVYKREDLFTCVSPCNAALYGDAWMFVWSVAYWAGIADSDEALICVLEQIAPQHTLLVDNARAWQNGALSGSPQWRAVVYSPALEGFVAVANVGTGTARVATSPDGINWTMQAASDAFQWNSIAWSPSLNLFVAVSDSGANRVMTSPDGVTWTTRTAAGAHNWWHVIWAAELGLFVAVGSSFALQRVRTSPDGINWTLRTEAAALSWNEVAWSPSLTRLIAVADTGANRVMRSADGITWTIVADAVAGAGAWVSVCWSPALGLFAAVGSSAIMTSPDGLVWTARTGSAVNWKAVRWISEIGSFVAVGVSSPGLCNVSLDGITWYPLATGYTNDFEDVAYSPKSKVLVAVSSNKTTTRSIYIKDRAPVSA